MAADCSASARSQGNPDDGSPTVTSRATIPSTICRLPFRGSVLFLPSPLGGEGSGVRGGSPRGCLPLSPSSSPPRGEGSKPSFLPGTDRTGSAHTAQTRLEASHAPPTIIRGYPSTRLARTEARFYTFSRS